MVKDGVVKICDFGLGIDYDNLESNPLESAILQQGNRGQ